MNLCGDCFECPAVVVLEPCLHAYCDKCVTKVCSQCPRADLGHEEYKVFEERQRLLARMARFLRGILDD
jgi:hypothetical protein